MFIFNAYHAQVLLNSALALIWVGILLMSLSHLLMPNNDSLLVIFNAGKMRLIGAFDVGKKTFLVGVTMSVTLSFIYLSPLLLWRVLKICQNMLPVVQ